MTNNIGRKLHVNLIWRRHYRSSVRDAMKPAVSFKTGAAARTLALVLVATSCSSGPVLAETYLYDPRGQLVGVGYPSGDRVGYVYDSMGNIAIVTTNEFAHDATSPTVSIVSPASNTICASPFVTITGTAFDDNQVMSVFGALGTNAWQLAMTTNNWTNWSASAVLAFGTNIFSAYAIDGANNLSLTNSVSIIYQPSPPTLAPPTWTPNLASFGASWVAISGLQYQVVFKERLDSSSWSNWGSPLLATNDALSFSDLVGTNRQRFYRVMLLP